MTTKQRDPKPANGGTDRSIQDLFRLDGRTIIITGGGGSVGLEAARAILESGADVICLDRQDEPLQELWGKVQQTAESTGGKVWYFHLDATNSADVQNVFAAALSDIRFPLRGLVCCAGISGEGSSLTFSADQMRRIIDVNVMGTFLCAREAARHFQRQSPAEPGSFVLIASMSAHVSNQGVDTVAYNSSKAAVAQMTRSLAAEWGSRADMPLIRVNSVSPGYIQTRMSAESMSDPDTKRLWTEGNMLCRLSEAHEYRGVVVFLLSDASGYTTGADVRVDGGHTAW